VGEPSGDEREGVRRGNAKMKRCWGGEGWFTVRLRAEWYLERQRGQKVLRVDGKRRGTERVRTTNEGGRRAEAGDYAGRDGGRAVVMTLKRGREPEVDLSRAGLSIGGRGKAGRKGGASKGTRSLKAGVAGDGGRGARERGKVGTLGIISENIR